MKKLFLSLCITPVLLFLGSCDTTTETNEEVVDQNELLSNLFNADNLPQQTFQISPDSDTLLVGENGTILRIYKNSFVDEEGNSISEPIAIELKEAFSPIDIVNANLTTTSNGKPLQTEGMVYIDATCKSKPLKLADNSSIGVIVPSDTLQPDMQIFKGQKTENGINWVEPIATLNDEVKELEKQNEISEAVTESPEKVVMEINGVEAIFNFVDADTTGMHEAQLNEAADVAVALPDAGQFTNELADKGQNYFSVDYSTSYIFELKDLGWANIDRLYLDPRTELVELETKITNSEDFDRIYITMVISKMYLPGYEMNNGTFSFTHGDYEKPKLPIGEKAIIFATAYKDNSPYFDLISTSIKQKETLVLNLKKTTEEVLKTTLKNKL